MGTVLKHSSSAKIVKKKKHIQHSGGEVPGESEARKTSAIPANVEHE